METLNETCLDTLAACLDDCSVANFRLASRRCYNVIKMHHGVWFEVARLLRENYKIIYTNLSREIPAWRALKQYQICLLGECHVSPGDRMLNAQLVNHLMPDRLIVEGQADGIEKGKSQLSHVADTLAERAESWDIQDDQLWKNFSESYLNMDLGVWYLLKHICVSEVDSETVFFSEKVRFIWNRVGQAIKTENSDDYLAIIFRIDRLFQEYSAFEPPPRSCLHAWFSDRLREYRPLAPSLELVERDFSGQIEALSDEQLEILYYLERRVRWSALMKAMVDLFFDCFSALAFKVVRLVDERSDARNDSLFQKTKESSNEGQRVVGLAGAFHVQSEKLRKKFKTLGRKTLLLVPKIPPGENPEDKFKNHPEVTIGGLSPREKVVAGSVPSNFHVRRWIHFKALCDEANYWIDLFSETIQARDALLNIKVQ